MSRSELSAEDLMTIVAARHLEDGATCLVGIGLPSAACNLARLLHAPNLILIYESGTIGSKPRRLPLSIGDGELAETADVVVSVPEIFAYWLQAGRLDVGFLGAAQIDRYANLNSTVIGSYEAPTVRLPGSGGACEIAAQAGRVLVMLRQSPRSFVQRLDFITSAGYLQGGPDARALAGLTGAGPHAVITDLAVLMPEPETKELIVSSIHPGISREAVEAATGWPVRFAPDVAATPPATAREIAALRTLTSVAARNGTHR